MKVDMEDEGSRIGIFRRTTNNLVRCGFRANQKGYRYLREAVCIAYLEPEFLDSVTKRLYPEVAKRFDTTDKKVERAIRSAIETAWIQGKSDTLRKIFKECYGDGTVRPTNTEVIVKLIEEYKNAGEFRE